MFCYILFVTLLISQVKSHGRFLSPLPRSGDYNGQGCYVSWDQHYLNGPFKCNNVCGNFWGKETGEADPAYENTGPIRATYRMGQTIEVRFDQTGHLGITRFYLCKLNKASDVVNQECLNQNLLEIRNLNGQDMKLRDKFTVMKDTHSLVTATVSLKLPDGLSCDNCVLQYHWITFPGDCVYADGSKAPSTYCLNQEYKGCTDVRIENDPSRPNQVYNQIHVDSVFPDPPAHPPVFWFLDWPDMKKNGQGQIIKIQNDPLAYKGTGLICFAYDRFILRQFVADPAYGRMCRENCMSPSRTCPNECVCRWFNIPGVRLDPIAGGVNPTPVIGGSVNPTSDNANQNTGGTVALWEQCGGDGWKGARNCASGASCVTQGPGLNQWYHQCQPIVPLWAQCGGEGWRGLRNCGPSARCATQGEGLNQWYHQCRP